ncbi:MAG: IscS subfamily cysteine desulfurase [Planctomycetes bacterium]|jgi:cysteine desulfurase|nr:IscS subfamily cysteine desulfurase [Planctomycetota bacterium]MDP6409351.1 IscS subfamily cysteine desulfurase [Planctomycetota bacterium]
MDLPIYLDYQATTPVDPRVLEAMLPYFTERFGNAASRSHAFGWAGEEAVDRARKQVASLIGASPKEIVFTSGSTEAINLALKGVGEMYASKGKHIVTSQVEHKAVLDTCKHLEKQGFEVTYLEPSPTGRVSVETVAAALREDTCIVALIWANNEIGTLNPIREIGELCHERNALLFTDATQAVGKVPVDVERDGVDLLCLSAHKLYGPKGIGCLYVRRRNPRVRLVAQMDGGGHERGMRSGTLNVPGIVGIGEACALCERELDADSEHARALRDRFEGRIFAELDHVHLNGDREHRLPNCSNVSFAYVEGESLIMGVNDVAVSSGSACTSASLEPSHVLRACGVGDDLAHSSIRFGFGRFTTEEEVDHATQEVIAAVRRLRELSPLYEMVQEGVDPGAIDWSGSH